MSTRGGGYGMDRELAAKSRLKYDPAKESEAQRWMESVTDVKFAGPDFASSLKDGQILCILVNRIKPGTIRKVETSKMPFKQMENISNFLKACRTLGVAEHDLFETVDLFEAKDLGVVVTCIHALGRTVQTTVPDFRGPHLGAKMPSTSAASFRKSAPAPAPTVSSQGKLPGGTYYGLSKFATGSSKTMEKAGFNDTKSITFGADTVGTGATNEVSKQSMGSSKTMDRSEVSTSNSITFGSDASKPKPPPAAGRKWGSNTRPPPAPSSALPSAPLSTGSSSAPPKAMARGGGYGLDAELARKAALKYDVNMENEARAWIENVTGEQVPGTFADGLKDGQMLCKLINVIRPGAIRKIGVSKMPFKQMENISNFLKACRGLGVAEHDLFETVDLYEEKDMGVVVTCIHALGRAAQAGGYRGPKLGAKQATKNVRTFDAGQVKDVGMTKLSMGSYGKMERSTVNDTNSINFGAKMAGESKGGGVVTKLMEGSSKVMERSKVNDTNSINFGAKASGESVQRGGTVMQNIGSSKVMERTEVSKSNNITFGADSSSTTTTASASPPIAETQITARVLFDYKATETNELSLREGTIIIILDNKSDPDGWWKGKDTAGKVGLFPHNYVSIL